MPVITEGPVQGFYDVSENQQTNLLHLVPLIAEGPVQDFYDVSKNQQANLLPRLWSKASMMYLKVSRQIWQLISSSKYRYRPHLPFALLLT